MPVTQATHSSESSGPKQRWKARKIARRKRACPRSYQTTVKVLSFKSFASACFSRILVVHGLRRVHAFRMFRKLIARFLPGGGTTLSLAPGDAAPTFHCLDHELMLMRSDELLGTRYVLWFYPKADTGG